jgi:trimethylamine--corrinoid protein Co-methyltransferase
VDLSENGQGMDAIREVGPGTHYLACAHTQANFETPSIAPTSPTTTASSSGRARAASTPPAGEQDLEAELADYEPPPIDPGIDEALKEFIAEEEGLDARQQRVILVSVHVATPPTSTVMSRAGRHPIFCRRHR